MMPYLLKLECISNKDNPIKSYRFPFQFVDHCGLLKEPSGLFFIFQCLICAIF